MNDFFVAFLPYVRILNYPQKDNSVLTTLQLVDIWYVAIILQHTQQTLNIGIQSINKKVAITWQHTLPGTAADS